MARFAQLRRPSRIREGADQAQWTASHPSGDSALAEVSTWIWRFEAEGWQRASAASSARSSSLPFAPSISRIFKTSLLYHRQNDLRYSVVQPPPKVRQGLAPVVSASPTNKGTDTYAADGHSYEHIDSTKRINHTRIPTRSIDEAPTQLPPPSPPCPR